MALDPTWQIIPPGGTVPVVASTLGITEITGNFRSLTPDTVTLTVDGRNVDAAALFAYGSTVTILRVVTTGKTRRRPPSGSSAASPGRPPPAAAAPRASPTRSAARGGTWTT